MATTLIVALGSFRQALLIAAVGLASVGLGLFALWVFDYPLGFMAIIGIMGLIGIAINDSIVVLAALSNSEAVNRGDLQATVRVVLNATRHVVSTTLTTAIAFLPLILWVQGGFWPPVAITIAAGVLGATLLALTFIPCGYRLLVCRRPLERG
jgi:multidrug efflux pump subunit AcrB